MHGLPFLLPVVAMTAGCASTVATTRGAAGDAAIPGTDLGAALDADLAADGGTGGGTVGDDASGSPGPPALRLALGNLHSCARLPEGTVRCWGDNEFGEVGVLPPQQIPLLGPIPLVGPVTVPGVTDAVDVAVDYEASCALRRDGTVWCWGSDRAGSLGRGINRDGLPPAPVPGVTGVTQIVARDLSGSNVCARRTNGRVLCWGAHQGGAPPADLGLTDVVEIAGGGGATFCARFRDGTVQCGGHVIPVSDVVQISADAHGDACALRRDGTLRCWGPDDLHLLGLADAGGAPVDLGLQGVAQVACGEEHICARLQDGTVQCWGANAVGQLGDGTRRNHATPLPVPGLDDVVWLAVGLGATCAVRVDGSLWCWGGAIALPFMMPDGLPRPTRITL